MAGSDLSSGVSHSERWARQEQRAEQRRRARIDRELELNTRRRALLNRLNHYFHHRQQRELELMEQLQEATTPEEVNRLCAEIQSMESEQVYLDALRQFNEVCAALRSIAAERRNLAP